MTDRLDGQVALVTGASRGIGRAIATALAAAGMRVALLARSADGLREAAAELAAGGATTLAVPADVTDPDRVEGAIRTVEHELGPIDLLVNNAGSFGGIGPVWEVDPDEWWADVAVNLRGPFLCCRAVLPGMLERARGRIINVVGGGTTGAFPHGSGYAASKAGLMRLTEGLAEELREAGAPVAVFAVSPGLVRTALTENQLTSSAGRRWMDRTRTMLETGRDRPPEEAARLVAALAGGRFDRLTGRFFGAADDLDRVLEQQEEILRKDRRLGLR